MDLKAIAEDNNPWWGDPVSRLGRRYPFVRDLQAEVLSRLLDFEDRRATVILGPRQVGKTTLLLQTADMLLDRGWPAQNLTYFDFSDDRVTEPVTAREVVDIRPVGLVADHPRALLLDEVHLAPNWNRWLKRTVDRDRHRILVTDSAASVLRDAARESGQGRWDELRLEGLTFTEFIRMQADPGESVEAAAGRMPNLLERYLALGGFPEHVLADDLSLVRRRLRSDAVERAILRDLSRHVESVEPVRDLFVYLVQVSGGILNASGIGSELGRDERSIRRWLGLLEDTHLIASLPRHAARASSSLRARPKLYAADHGLISAFSVLSRQEPALRGQLFEAAVFRHLREAALELGGELSYFRPRQTLEIDFVLETPKTTTAIEVTSSRRIKSERWQKVRRAADAVGASKAILIHGSVVDQPAEGVTSLPLQRFLLDPVAGLESG
jgi:predicted AAA+ superfamily ATPase